MMNWMEYHLSVVGHLVGSWMPCMLEQKIWVYRNEEACCNYTLTYGYCRMLLSEI